jgi:uncharacterized protein YcfJ
MKSVLLLGGMLILAPSLMSSAFAAGCVRGAVVGGVIGHFAGHHGMVGAAAGCAVGHHDANKRDRYDENRYGYDPDRSGRNDPR